MTSSSPKGHAPGWARTRYERTVPASVRDVIALAVREWDRVLIGLSFVGFALWDLLVPDISPVAAAFEWPRIVQFALAGATYIVGVLRKSYLLRGAGTVLYATGLANIAVVVLLGSRSPTLLLIFAFALQGFADLRRLRLKNLKEAVQDEVDFARRTREGRR